ncbi:uncharacterized protein LOC144530058 isoform X2 [Sander vitreus]
MNAYNFPNLNMTAGAQAYPYPASLEDPLYRQYKPIMRDMIPLPKAAVYVLMAALVVVGVAYAIVGHLIKDLAIDIAECVLGPTGEEEKERDKQKMAASHPPAVHPFAHNAFHVWDQDDVVIPMGHNVSPQSSPLLLVSHALHPVLLPALTQPDRPWLSGLRQQHGVARGRQGDQHPQGALIGWTITCPDDRKPMIGT